MIKIEINSLPPGEVIKDIADIMGVPYFLNGKEFKVVVPLSWGKGTISAFQFDGGFGLLMYDCEFIDEVEIQFLDDHIQPLKFMYCLEGHFMVRLENKEEFFVMEKYHSTILASKGENGHVFRFPMGTSIKIRNVEFNRQLFNQKFSNQERGFASQLQYVFKDLNAKKAFYHEGMYSVTLNALFRRIDDYPHDGIIRSVFIEGVALEVLSEQLCLYEDDLNGYSRQGRLREYELSCIDKATRIIDNELEDICTVPELAHRVGLNVNKLQEGFKIIYKMTVNQYVHTNRIKRSTHLLRYSNKNISEIVTKIGLNSKSYFSKIFKEEYGITPSSYRSKMQQQDV